MVKIVAVVAIVLVSLMAVTHAPEYKSAIAPLRRTEDGDITVDLRIGTPTRDVRLLVDFQSEISGIWSEDLSHTSKSFCEECIPTTREMISFGPYRYFLQFRSLPYEARIGSNTWMPSPRDGMHGWLALGPLSELRLAWSHILLENDNIEFLHYSKHEHVPVWLGKLSHVPLVTRAENDAWRAGWLVCPVFDQKRTAQWKSDLRTLSRFSMQNHTYVMMGNTSTTRLSQKFHNALFTGANLYKPDTLPAKIVLSPGLRLDRRTFYHWNWFKRFASIDVGYLPRSEANLMVQSHGMSSIDPSDLSIIGYGILRSYALSLDYSTNSLLFVPVSYNGHIDPWKLCWIIIMSAVFVIWFTLRVVYLRPLSFLPTVKLRTFDMKRLSEIGFGESSLKFLFVLQYFSTATQVVGFYTSDKIFEIHNLAHGTLIFYAFIIGINVLVLLQFINSLIFTYASFFAINYSKESLDRLRARTYVLNRAVHTQGILLVIWIITMDRTGLHITNLASSLFSIFMLFDACVETFILMDRVFHRSSTNANAQLWTNFIVNVQSTLSDRLTFIYALFTLLIVGAWFAWLCVFTPWLQLDEQMRITLTTISPWSAQLLAIAVALLAIRSGLSFARIMSMVNHIRHDSKH